MFPRNLAMLLCPAAGGAATMGGATPATPVYFLFTTIPPHAARLAQIANEMRRQHHRPTGIVLTLPARYHRFNASETAALHDAANEWQSRTSGVRIHNVPTDHGPLLKYFGSRVVDPASALCVVGDDDVTYRPHWLQRFVNASSALPAALRRAVVITGNYDPGFGPLSPGVKGVAGVAMSCSTMSTLPLRIERLCFLVDDVVVTKAARDRKLRLSSLLGSLHGNGIGPLYEQTAYSHDATSIFSHHKAHGFRTNRECVAALTSSGAKSRRV